MISVREFTFRTEQSSFPVRFSHSLTPVRPHGCCWVSFARTRPAAHLGEMTGTANKVSPTGAGSGAVGFDGFFHTLWFGACFRAQCTIRHVSPAAVQVNTPRCHGSLSCNSRDFRLGLKHIPVATHGACPQPTPHAQHLPCVRWEREELPWTLAVSS